MAKSDLPAALQRLYFPSAGQPVLVDVPRLNFLLVDGAGDPQGPGFQQAVEALYGICYTVKFMHDPGSPVRAARVMPLEALWWTRGTDVFDISRRGEWQWTAMIMQPAPVTRRHVTAAVAELRRKKNPPALERVRFASLTEGHCVQVMHIGPYAAEVPTIERLHRFAAEQGYRVHGKHHEIYLGDPRRTRPERLKTVLRQPVRKA